MIKGLDAQEIGSMHDAKACKFIIFGGIQALDKGNTWRFGVGETYVQSTQCIEVLGMHWHMCHSLKPRAAAFALCSLKKFKQPLTRV